MTPQRASSPNPSPESPSQFLHFPPSSSSSTLNLAAQSLNHPTALLKPDSSFAPSPVPLTPGQLYSYFSSDPTTVYNSNTQSVPPPASIPALSPASSFTTLTSSSSCSNFIDSSSPLNFPDFSLSPLFVSNTPGPSSSSTTPSSSSSFSSCSSSTTSTSNKTPPTTGSCTQLQLAHPAPNQQQNNLTQSNSNKYSPQPLSPPLAQKLSMNPACSDSAPLKMLSPGHSTTSSSSSTTTTTTTKLANSNSNNNSTTVHLTGATPPSLASSASSFTDKQLDQASSDASQQPRQRSRNGCFTCRRRKKRCDEARPVCKACVRLKLECIYPIPGQERKNKKRKAKEALEAGGAGEGRPGDEDVGGDEDIGGDVPLGYTDDMDRRDPEVQQIEHSNGGSDKTITQPSGTKASAAATNKNKTPTNETDKTQPTGQNTATNPAKRKMARRSLEAVSNLTTFPEIENDILSSLRTMADREKRTVQQQQDIPMGLGATRAPNVADDEGASLSNMLRGPDGQHRASISSGSGSSNMMNTRAVTECGSGNGSGIRATHNGLSGEVGDRGILSPANQRCSTEASLINGNHESLGENSINPASTMMMTTTATTAVGANSMSSSGLGNNFNSSSSFKRRRSLTRTLRGNNNDFGIPPASSASEFADRQSRLLPSMAAPSKFAGLGPGQGQGDQPACGSSFSGSLAELLNSNTPAAASHVSSSTGPAMGGSHGPGPSFGGGTFTSNNNNSTTTASSSVSGNPPINLIYPVIDPSSAGLAMAAMGAARSPSPAPFGIRTLHSMLASPSFAGRSPRIEELCNDDDDTNNNNHNSNNNDNDEVEERNADGDDEEEEEAGEENEGGNGTEDNGDNQDNDNRNDSQPEGGSNIGPTMSDFEEYDFGGMRTPDIFNALSHENNSNNNPLAGFANSGATSVGPSAITSPSTILTNFPSLPSSPGPILFSTPTPWYTMYLDHFGIEMFSYYNNHLANMVCVSSKMNSFINVFVPMAQQDPSVLYALVAYASFHHNMGRYEDIGLKYLNKAIKMVRNDISKHNLTTLACILIITTAEICKGDMVHWNKHLSAAADVIQMRGGIEAFTHDPTKRWLATNFVYHDLLAASKYESKSHFEPKDVELVMRMDTGVHSLIGCCKPLFSLLAEVSDLAVEAQEVYSLITNPYLDDYHDNDNEADAADKSSYPNGSGSSASGSRYPIKAMLSSQRKISEKIRYLYHRLDLLEAKIDDCKPDPNDVLSLSKSSPCDLEQQLTLFETFQLATKLHLYQSIGRRNAASLQMQVLANELTTSLEVVLNTKVEGSLLFPLFIACIMAITDKQRARMVALVEGFYQRQLARNIVRTLDLAKEVWKLDMGGTKYVNWYKVLEQHGWDICFS